MQRPHGMKHWREFLLVVVLVVIGDWSFRFVGKAFLFSPWAGSGDISIAEELFWVAGHQPDVVFIGDSRTGNGLKPLTVERILSEHGIQARVVSVWLAGAGTIEGRQISDRILANNPPRLVIFNLNETRLSLLPQKGATSGWYERVLDRSLGLEKFKETADWYSRQIAGTLRWGAFVQRAFYNAAFGVARIILGERISMDGMGQQRGYMPRFGRQRSINLEALQIVDDERYANYHVTAWGKIQLDVLLSTLQSYNLQSVVVIMPVSPSLYSKFPEERYRDFIQQTTDITRAHGVPLVNYYQESRLPTDSFFDNHHMNDVGAEAFSRQMAEEVVLPALQNWKQFKIENVR